MMGKRILLGLLLLASCMPRQDITARDTTFIVARAIGPLSLDPAIFATGNEAPIQELFYHQLLALDRSAPDGLAPELATAWTVSEDGKTLDFTLRQDWRFASGRAVDAVAAAFSLNRVLALGRWSAGYIDWLERAEATGPYALRIHLKRPYAPALPTLALSVASIVDPSVLNDGGDLTERSAGSGPYQLSAIALDGSVIAVPNPAYPNPPRRFTRIEWRIIPDEGVRRLLLERGDIDFTDNVPAAFVSRYDRLPGVDVTLGAAGKSLAYLVLNTQKGVFTDARVRRAAQKSIDYEALETLVLKGNATALNSYIPPGSTGFNDTAAPVQRDLEGARALLATAGYDGQPIRFLTSQIGPVGEFLQSNLKEAGFNIDIVRRDSASIDALKQSGSFDMVYEGWLLDFADPSAMLYGLYHSQNVSSGLNPSKFSDASLDTLLEQLLLFQPPREKSATLRQVDAALKEAAPIVMLFSANPVAAYNAQITDLRMDPDKPFYHPFHEYGLAVSP